MYTKFLKDYSMVPVFCSWHFIKVDWEGEMYLTKEGEREKNSEGKGARRVK